MKKTLHRVGASALAVATITTGLSFGPAAVAAPATPSSSSERSAQDPRVVTPAVVTSASYTPDGWIEIKGTAEADAEIKTTNDPNAGWYSIEGGVVRATDGRFTVRTRRLVDGQAVVTAFGKSGPSTSNTINVTGFLTSATIGLDDRLTFSGWATPDSIIKTTWDPNAGWWDDVNGRVRADNDGRFTTQAWGLVDGKAVIEAFTKHGRVRSNSITPTRSLEARAIDQDLEAGTATLEGVAPEDATIVEVNWTDATGAQHSELADVVAGTWSQQLTGLALGTTSVSLTALDGATPIVESSVEVDLAVTPLTATARFATDRPFEQNAMVSGQATPGATVEAWHDGTRVGSATAVDGEYEISVKAPEKAGTYDLEIVQVLRGQEQMPAAQVQIDYAEGVEITNPATDMDLVPGQPLRLATKGQKDAPVTVVDKADPDTILATGKHSATSGTTILRVDGLEDREYQLVVTQQGIGNNATTAEVTVNPGKSTVEAPVVQGVDFATDPAQPATVHGTGVTGATITVKDGDQVLGATTVRGTSWSLPITSPGAGEHELTIEQTGIEGTQTATTTADFGDAVTAPATLSPTGATTTLSGTGEDDALVVVTDGAREIGRTTVAGGTWSIDADRIPAGQSTWTTTQTARGATTTTATTTVERVAEQEPLVVTSPNDGDTFTDQGVTTLTGTATPGATVEVYWFGEAVDIKSTVLADPVTGDWNAARGLGGTRPYTIDLVQRQGANVLDRVSGFTLAPVNLPRDLTVANYANGDEFATGLTTLRGKATGGSTVTVYWFGASVPDVTTTTTAAANGDWSVSRGLGGTRPYPIHITQAPAPTGKVAELDLTLRAPGSAPIVTEPADVVVTSHTSGDAFTAGGMTTLRGTATPGASVTVYWFGSELTQYAMTTKADPFTGQWSLSRGLGGTRPYTIDIAQDPAPEGKISFIDDFVLTPPTA